MEHPITLWPPHHRPDTLRLGVGATPWGWALVAWHRDGVVHLALADDEARLWAEWRADWPEQAFERDDAQAAQWLRPLLPQGTPANPVPVVLRGTPFQQQVWQALLHVPLGETLTYTALAQRIGRPTAARAVGSAVAANRIAVLVPCHRVVPQQGGVGGYRWGVPRKVALLGAEANT